jgi:hypothetical protein
MIVGLMVGIALFALLYRLDISIAACAIESSLAAGVTWSAAKQRASDPVTARLVLFMVVGLFAALDLAEIAQHWVGLHIPARSLARVAIVTAAWCLTTLCTWLAGLALGHEPATSASPN